MGHPPRVGIDFGTTNSAIAVASGDTVQIARFPFFGNNIDTFRSILFFEQAEKGRPVLKPLAGPAAIERYLEPHEGGRLIQSLKSFAASSTFQSTQIGFRQYKLEDLIGIFLRILRAAAEQQFGPLGNRAVVGRPVRFVGANQKDAEQLALGRLRRAYEIAGFEDLEFEYEPIGAAYAYALRSRLRELVLIADFGGGTSDFSLIHLEPNGEHRIVATAGVPIGGDTFDARIVRHLVSPMLGLGSTYRSGEKTLPVPTSFYRQLESWHHLSFLRSRENLRMIESVRAQSSDRLKLDRLLEIVEGDLGYHLHRSVQKTKVDLSLQEEAPFEFTHTSIEIRHMVQRKDFERWIAEDLRKIQECVVQLLQTATLTAADVHRVFLTGGSSLTPALRRIFAAQFGESKLASGEEFTSVARGLALRSTIAKHTPEGTT